MNNLTEKQLSHRAYLQSPLWKQIRKKALDKYGEVCFKCKERGTDVHHLTYERAGGNELIEDLQVLCRGCHEAIHAVERANQKQLQIQRAQKRRKGVTINALFSFLTENQKKIIEEMFSCPAYSALIAPTEQGKQARKKAKEMLDVDYIVGITELRYCESR